jgi:hypothetical protein
METSPQMIYLLEIILKIIVINCPVRRKAIGPGQCQEEATYRWEPINTTNKNQIKSTA